MSDLMTCGEFKAMIRDLPDHMPITFGVTEISDGDYFGGEVDKDGVLVLYEGAYATSEGDREVIRIEVKVS